MSSDNLVERNKKVIFIGGLVRYNEFGDELTKNRLNVKRMRELDGMLLR